MHAPMRTEDQRPALTVRNVSKTFSGTRALKDVSLEFRRGAVTALLGPNGCGKSTLIKILAGFHEPDPGAEIILGSNGALSLPIDPKVAYKKGLRFVHQDLGLVGDMSVADNLAFAHAYRGQAIVGPIRSSTLHRRAKQALDHFSLDVDPEMLVRDLSRTNQILVAIARAFQESPESQGGQIVLLDEPTASLPARSVDDVLRAVAQIRASGGTVIYVTHRIDEVLRIADDVVVLRDGHLVAAREVGDMDAAALTEVIIGGQVTRPSSERVREDASVVLEVKDLSGNRLQNVSFTLHEGEVLGVAGLAGCGRSELARVVAGAQRADAGDVLIDGEKVQINSPIDAIRHGVVFVPPERTRYACIPDLSVRTNISLSDLSPFWSRGLLRQRRERGSVAELLEQFDVRPRETERRMRYLSGGNQQKAVFAKVARLKPKIIVVDEPTQGVDVAGKQEIGRVMRGLASEGCAVLLASSDFDEIAELCDRVLVLDRGSVLGIFDRGAVHEETLAAIGNQREVGVA